MDECIFCKIVNGEAPAEVIAENEKAIAFVSIKPAADTHILVIPKIHMDSFLNLDLDGSLVSMSELAQEVIKKIKIEDAYKLVFNGGKYQAIGHVHWHILGGEMHRDGT